MKPDEKAFMEETVKNFIERHKREDRAREVEREMRDIAEFNAIYRPQRDLTWRCIWCAHDVCGPHLCDGYTDAQTQRYDDGRKE